MRSFFCALFILAASSAFADNTSTIKMIVKDPEPTPAAGFHWLTRRCVVEENNEIETTPGSPPLVVDDPATPGCNKWEINIVFDGDFTREEKSIDLPLLDINYGIGDNLQLKFEIPNVVSENPDARTTEVGNSKAGVKFQFYGDDETRLQMAVYPQVEFFSAGLGSKDNADQTPDAKSANSKGNIITLPVLVAKRIARLSRGDVMMSMNLGYNLSSKPDTANFVSASLGLGAPLVNKISIVAELTTEQAVDRVGEELREQIIKANIGLMSPVGNHFAVFGSIGKSLVASDEKDHNYLLAGVRILTGE